MRHPILCLLLAFILAACGEPATPPDLGSTPFDMKRARLPWPAANKGFEFKGHLRLMGAPMGTVNLSASAREDAPGWKTTMHAEIKAAGMTIDSTALFDRYLTPVSGTYAESNAEGTKSSEWAATEKGLEIRAKGDEDAEPTLIEHEGAFVTGVMEMFLFCRLSEFAGEKYEIAVVDIDKAKLVQGTWTCNQGGTWETEPATVLSGTRSDGKTLEAGFHAESGELLGVKMAEGAQVFEFRKGDAPKESNNFFQRPATTAQEAAVQAALAFATADIELLERIVHWPSAYAHLIKGSPEADIGVDELKGVMLKKLRETLKAQGSPEMLGPILQALAPSLKTTGTDEETVVEFGPNFRNMKLTVGKREGTWRLLKLPEN